MVIYLTTNPLSLFYESCMLIGKNRGSSCTTCTQQAGGACRRDGVSRQLFNPALFLMASGLVRQRRRDDPRPLRGDRGRHVTGQDRAHHRYAAPRALPVPASAAGLHPEKERKQNAAARPAVMVG